MTPKQKLSFAICSILGTYGASSARAADTPSESDAIGEIVVTAQRRTENIQDVPIQIQALTAETLSQLNVVNFDQFIKYLPNVTQSTNGPAQGDIFMRGLSVGGGGGQGGGTTGAFPAVAIYLDEQSGQVPGRNLDIYAADLERIEVLEGPQGTLFGGGALSGVLRYITNKPKLDVTEGNVDAGYGITAHGDPNSNVTAVLNVPLIENTLAVRGVIYSDRQGGYINNLPATFTRSGTDLGLARNNGGVVPTDSVSINNNNLIANDINPLTYTGIRVGAPVQDQQRLERLADAVVPEHRRRGRVLRDAPRHRGRLAHRQRHTARRPAAAAAVGDTCSTLPITRTSSKTPRWSSTEISATLSWSTAAPTWCATSTSSRTTRTTRAACTATTINARATRAILRPGSATRRARPGRKSREHTHNSQELRLSTPDDKRIRGLVGVYWEKYDITDRPTGST